MRFAPVARKDSGAPATQARTTQRFASPAPVSSVGHPLGTETRRYFENRFGHDFSKVRVHADSTAASSAKSAAAQAYTVGHDITFGSGMFNPKSPSGRKLLAHELTHVVQQDKPSAGSAFASQHESEAADASQQAARGERASVGLAAPVSMQRQPLPGTIPHTDLTESASPLMASAIGSTTLDGFVTGQSDVSDANQARLATTADTIMKLFKKYPASKIRVIGYTDAVGQEKDNQQLGQSRADSVQAALVALGIPPISIETESKGAGDLLIKTNKGEPRNRRVRVIFEPSTLLQGGLSKGLTPSSGLDQGQTPGGDKGGISDAAKKCVFNPSSCIQDPGPVGPVRQGAPSGAFSPVPDDTPYELMDVAGINANYTSHGQSPQSAGDMRKNFAEAFKRYKFLGRTAGAKAANLELSSTAGQNQSRDNPNSIDRSNTEMKNAYPNSTTVGPGSFTLFKF